jgi:hypothetical protein
MSGAAWTKREEAKLRRLYPDRPACELATLFDRTAKAIQSRAKVLKIHRKRANYHRWTAAESRQLRKLYPDGSNAKLARKFGTSVLSVYRRAAKLGIKKSPAFMAKHLRECGLQLRESGRSHQYPKGHVPANKGTRRPGYAAGRMRDTQFKKGQAPLNTMPLWSFRWFTGGSTNVAKPGYLLLKTGKPGPKPISGWEFVHKLIWEQARGPLPDWRIARIWWKDGDHANNALSNLELVASEAHMARTTVHNLPAPLVQVIQLAGALKRKIRNREEKLNGKEHTAGSAGSSVRDAGSAV